MKKFFITIFVIILIAGASYSVYYVINNKDNMFKKEEEKVTKDTLPKEDEPYENEETLKSKFVDDEDGKDIDLKYDQYVTANGYAGASDNVYYTRNGVLYHLILSTDKTIRLAEGVDKIENDIDGLKAYKGKDFKIIEEDEYVNYLD